MIIIVSKCGRRYPERAAVILNEVKDLSGLWFA